MLNNVYELEVMSRQLPDERAAEVANDRLVSMLRKASRPQKENREQQAARGRRSPVFALRAWLAGALR